MWLLIWLCLSHSGGKYNTMIVHYCSILKTKQRQELSNNTGKQLFGSNTIVRKSIKNIILLHRTHWDIYHESKITTKLEKFNNDVKSIQYFQAICVQIFPFINFVQQSWAQLMPIMNLRLRNQTGLRKVDVQYNEYIKGRTWITP